MKNTTYKHKTPKTQWYIFTDGKTMSVTTTPNEYVNLKGILVPISADEAAIVLALMVEQSKSTPEVSEG
jgi:hypothetical protein